MSYKKNLWTRFTDWLQSVKWWFQGLFANRRIQDGGEKRSEAEEELARIILETGIRPDSVSATTLRGGPCFLVTHEDASEAFIHNSYKEAADKAIEWLLLQDDEIKPVHQEGAQVLNRKQRRRFERERRQGYKKGRKIGKTVH